MNKIFEELKRTRVIPTGVTDQSVILFLNLNSRLEKLEAKEADIQGGEDSYIDDLMDDFKLASSDRITKMTEGIEWYRKKNGSHGDWKKAYDDAIDLLNIRTMRMNEPTGELKTEGEDMKCAKPNCDCVEKEMQKQGTEFIKKYPCLAKVGRMDELKSKVKAWEMDLKNTPESVNKSLSRAHEDADLAEKEIADLKQELEGARGSMRSFESMYLDKLREIREVSRQLEGLRQEGKGN